jgi:glycolate oxidase FAD binding subunit
VAKAGGKVVKNVAGYDLGKLFTGSLGTLGLVAEAIFRLHPVPLARCTVAVSMESPEAAGEAVQSALHSSLVPSALDLKWEGSAGTLLVLFEGIKQGVTAQSERAAEDLARHGRAVILRGEDERELWAKEGPREVQSDLKVSAPIAELPAVLREVTDAGARFGVDPPTVWAHAGVGVTHVGLGPADEEALVGAIKELRRRTVKRGGALVVRRAPPGVKARLDAWGEVGDALSLMRRVKGRFDPAGVMNPGRFVGGL